MSLDKRRDAILDEHIMIEVQEENARLAEIDRQKAEIIAKENKWSEPAFIRRRKSSCCGVEITEGGRCSQCYEGCR